MLWKCSDVAYTLRKEGEPRSASPAGEYEVMWAQVVKSLDFLGNGKRMTGQIQSLAVWVCKCMYMVYLFCWKETGQCWKDVCQREWLKTFFEGLSSVAENNPGTVNLFFPTLCLGNPSYSPTTLISSKDWTKMRRKNILWDHQNAQDRFPREAVRYRCGEVGSSSGVRLCAQSWVYQTYSSFENFGAGCFNI